MERYLGGEEIDTATLIEDLETAVARGSFHPVVPVCAMSAASGWTRCWRCWSAASRRRWSTRSPASPASTARRAPLTADPDGPLAAEVVRTSADAYVGPRLAGAGLLRDAAAGDRRCTSAGTSRGRPRRGATPPTTAATTPTSGSRTSTSRSAPSCREVDACVAGDIAALTKLGSAETGDTVSAAADPLLLSCWNLPDPLLPVAVVARSRADEDALGRSLTRLVAADPTLRLERNPETHQTVLWCMGEAHADVVLSRLRASGAEVDTEPVKVPLRATIRSRGAGDRAARQAVRRARPVRGVPRRVRAAAPRIGVRVRLPGGRRGGADAVHPQRREGHPHPARAGADRRAPPGRRRAGDAGGRQGAQRRLLGRRVPDRRARWRCARRARRAGRCCSNRSTRWPSRSRTTTSARCSATCPDAAAACWARTSRASGRTVVRAEVPCTELLRYAVDLRAMTSGTASFTRRRARYEVAPT